MRRRTSFMVVVVCLALPMFGGSGRIEKKARKIPNRYIVVLDDSLSPKAPVIASEMLKKHGVQITSVWEDALRGFSIVTTEAIAEKIGRDPRVLSIEEDQELEFAGLRPCEIATQKYPSRCADGALPWQLDRIDQVSLPLDGNFYHCSLSNGEGVSAYIIDSGIRATHQDFYDVNNVSRVVGGISFVPGVPSTTDCYGHGTSVAGALGGKNGGVAKAATLVPVRIADCAGSAGNNTRLVDAVNWVKNDHTTAPAVANMSYYASGSSSALDTAVAALITDGVVVTVAAGNGTGANACTLSPQKVAGTIVVGASTKTDARASFSNVGTCIAVFAPGQAIGGTAIAHDSYWDCNPGQNGTSVAAPLVAGVAAIIYQEYPWYTVAQIKAEIVNSASLNKLTGIPSGTPNRLLFSWNQNWCAVADLCYTPPPPPPDS
jgi:hypothetical protein